MSQPKKFKLHFLVLVVAFFTSSTFYSQKDSTKKWIRFSVNAGLIVNGTFSGYANPSFQGEDKSFGYHAFFITKVKNAPEYSTGFSIGLSSLLGKSLKHNFVVAPSISLTRSQRHESFYDRPHSLGPDYNYVHTEQDFSLQTLYANLEIGYKFCIVKTLFFQPSFILHYNLQTQEKRSGTKYEDTQDVNQSVFPPIWTNSHTVEQINEKVIYHGSTQGSFRITAFYQFKIKKSTYEVFAFKGWGIKYHLPWGGIGASFYF